MKFESQSNHLEKQLNVLLGTVIERRRVTAGISQESLAQEAGISRTYLSDIERGLRNISVYTLYKLAKGLKSSAATLVSEAEVAIVPGSETANTESSSTPTT